SLMLTTTLVVVSITVAFLLDIHTIADSAASIRCVRPGRHQERDVVMAGIRDDEANRDDVEEPGSEVVADVPADLVRAGLDDVEQLGPPVLVRRTLHQRNVVSE